MAPRIKILGLARHTTGIALIATTVFLWTASNFLLSNILADDSYSKPYFVTYVNTAFFSLFLGIVGIRHVVSHTFLGGTSSTLTVGSGVSRSNDEVSDALLQPEDHGAADDLVDNDLDRLGSSSSQAYQNGNSKLSIRETVYLALEFCLLWFFANFTLSVGLEYTTVASSSVLAATSGMFTLLFGVISKVERFTFIKLFGVLISLAGIAMISLIDVSADGDKHRGTFPHKTPAKVALGDILSLSSAILYGAYSVLMKKRIGSEDRVDMLLFFGFVGLINTIILWPGIIILHLAGLEPFELPSDSRITSVVILNAVISIVADLCWAYAVILTSPLVVTVGLSMSIPLALLGQMVIHSSSSPVVYWLGAILVFLAFGLINHESKQSKNPMPTVESRAS